ncbi:MAG: stage V sporulation protein AB [Oliverpabstia sp.]|nr:stage V sporulation protein AB [Lachnospiraceae bacterium]MDY5027577.1 stage V sporulation protein AB [Oliverpabstia sp.]
MLVKLWLGFLGICFGIIVASGAAAFVISLGLVPRYAGITRTAQNVRLYEDCSMLGAFLGNVLFLYSGRLSLGNAGLAIYGVFAGVFLGSWIIALGEVVNIFSIMARRIGITKGIGLIIIVMAVGKTLGSLLFFWKGW